MREDLHLEEADLFIGIQEQVAVFSGLGRELVAEGPAVPAGIRIEVILGRVAVGGVMVFIHEHRELVLLGAVGIEESIAVLVVVGIAGIAIIQGDVRGTQANLLEVDGGLHGDCKLAEERIIKIDFHEMLLLIAEVIEHGSKEALRRIGPLDGIRAVILKDQRLELFLVDILQLEGN